ncbi:MAG TPA: immunoglobulin domain-containing protein [Phycisphaerales bacterium]|nr:immunoglobulin domain-containing protein [Phycisphaerales bacterium]
MPPCTHVGSVCVRAMAIVVWCAITSVASADSTACLPAWNQSIGQPGMSTAVRAMTSFQGDLYAGGLFTTAGGASAAYIARWNGASWSAVGGGMDSDVMALCVFDDGSGPALYVGGTFAMAGALPVNRIAKWDGNNWSDVAGGVTGGEVRAMTVFDDGAGPALFVGGTFSSAGSVSARRVAKWDGKAWSALSSGMTGTPLSVDALAVFNDGSGSALFATGAFATAGGVAVANIAKWNGAAWSALGSGITGGKGAALAVFNDGRGEALYVGGDFTTAGGNAANRIARWNGSEWETLGSGISGGLVGVMGLISYDDGSAFSTISGHGSLFVTGGFNNAGGVSANNIARWNGVQWAAVGSGLLGGPFPLGTCLAIHSVPLGPALYVGGLFSAAGGQSCSHIARWSPTAILSLLTQPGCVSALSGTSATMSVSTSGTGTITYQWRRNEISLSDNDRITGAQAATLHIEPLKLSDAGVYDVVVTNVCGSLTSESAQFSVQPRSGDLNSDDVIDVLDLLILLTSWGPCPKRSPCPADLNQSGAVDVQDLLILLANWG